MHELRQRKRAPATSPSPHLSPSPSSTSNLALHSSGVEWRKAIIGSEARNPITKTIAVLGFQVLNTTAAGPIGKPADAAVVGKIDPADYRFQPPDTLAACVVEASACVDRATGYTTWFPGASVAAPVAKAGYTETLNASKGVVLALGRVAGVVQRAAPIASDVVRIGLNGPARPDNVPLQYRPATESFDDPHSGLGIASAASLQRAIVLAQQVAYADRAIGIQADRLMACVRPCVGGGSAAAFAPAPAPASLPDQFLAEFKARTQAAFEFDPDPDADQEGAAAVALDAWIARIDVVPDALRQPLKAMLELVWRATRARTQVDHLLAGQQRLLGQAQKANMRDASRRVLARATQIQTQVQTQRGPGPLSCQALTQRLDAHGLARQLRRFRGRLSARPADEVAGALAPDAAMQIVLNGTGVAFGRYAEVNALAAVALETLSGLGLRDLARASCAAGPSQSLPLTCALKLARVIASLRRGSELLQILCKADDSVDNAAASTQLAGPRQRKRLDALQKARVARRHVALQTLLRADLRMQDPRIGSESLIHLGQARAGALALIEHPEAQTAALTGAQRFAYNAAREGLMSLGSGPRVGDVDEINAIGEIDHFLKTLSTTLDSASRDATLVGRIARVLPIAEATPLNFRAVTASAVTLRQTGLIIDTADAMRLLRARIENLDGLGTSAAAAALRVVADAIAQAVPEDHQAEVLPRLTRADVAIPPGFGLADSDLNAHPAIRSLCERHEAGALWTLEAARALAVLLRDDFASGLEAAEDAEDEVAVAAAKTVHDVACDFIAALELAQASAIWNRGVIDSPSELKDALVAIRRLMNTRDRIKVSGGNMLGFDLSKLPVGFGSEGLISLSTRVNIAGSHRFEIEIDLGKSAQAWFLGISAKTIWSGRAGAALGLNVGAHFGGFMIGARPFEAGAAGGFERQWQDGVMLRIPLDNNIEAQLADAFDRMIELAVLPSEGGHANSPLRAILSNIDEASVSLLGRNVRTSYRGESLLGVYPLTIGGGLFQARAGVQTRWQSELKYLIQEELSGHYNVFELRADRLTTSQRTVQGTTNVRFLQKGRFRASVTDALSASLTADWPHGTGMSLRLVSMDGATSPAWTRLIVEFADLDGLKHAVDAARPRWIHHGNQYTEQLAALYPDDESGRQLVSEADYDQFFVDAATDEDSNKQYLILHSLQDSTAPRVDALMANIQLAAQMGDENRQHLFEAEFGAVLADMSNWQPRRVVSNEKSAQISQPGWGMGLVAGVSGTTEGVRNHALLPRA